MDFITWWFDKHYILSTLFCPEVTVLWAIYTHNAVRLLAVTIIFIIQISIMVIGKILQFK